MEFIIRSVDNYKELIFRNISIEYKSNLLDKKEQNELFLNLIQCCIDLCDSEDYINDLEDIKDNYENRM